MAPSKQPESVNSNSRKHRQQLIIYCKKKNVKPNSQIGQQNSHLGGCLNWINFLITHNQRQLGSQKVISPIVMLKSIRQPSMTKEKSRFHSNHTHLMGFKVSVKGWNEYKKSEKPLLSWSNTKSKRYYRVSFLPNQLSWRPSTNLRGMPFQSPSAKYKVRTNLN